MANTLKLGNGKWATGKDTVMSFSDTNNNFKPLPFDFSRASSATVVNQSGLIETVQSGTPRIDFLGNTKGALLLEPTRINRITQSEAFDNSYWTKTGSSVVGGFSSPSADSPLGAFKLVEDTSTAPHRIISSIATTLAGVNSISIYIKKGELKNIGLKESQETGKYASFDLVNLTVLDKSSGVEANINSQINGWIKLSMQVAITSTLIRFSTHLLPNSYTSGDPNSSYTGDGTSGLYIFGAQLEAGSYATSYIPTSGQSGGVTRVADACNNGGNEQVINSTEGVLYTEISALADDGTNRIISLSDGTSSNRVLILYQVTSNLIRGQFSVSGQSTITINQTVDTTQFRKIAINWNSTSVKLYINGQKIAETSTGYTFNSNVLKELAFDNVSGGEFYGKCKDVKVYNTALTDAELQALTTI